MTVASSPSAELLKLREFLTPDRWTQGAFARDKRGKPVGSRSAAATCWCVAGAGERVGVLDRARAFLNAAASEIHGGPWFPAWVNDRLGYDATMRMVDRAIELAHDAEQQEPSA